jgi:uncharacterized protein YfaS (alpha-2-macroglobulin family)
MKKVIFVLSTIFLTLNQLNAQTMNDYSKEWLEVEGFDNQGLPKSALEKVERLYARAKADKNPTQIIKTLIFKSKYKSQLEEDGFVKSVTELEAETTKAGFPEKPLLQSMLGELYAGYLDGNYWRMQGRSKVSADFKNEDIRTWDVAKLNEKASQYYRASLEDERTKTLAVKNLDAITTEGTDALRPTVYDFLAHRALVFLTNSRTYLSEPAYKFYLDQKECFAPADDFVKIKFETKDEQSQKYLAIRLMQDILRHQLKNSDPTALIDADLIRLDFCKENAVIEGKDEAYLNALEFLQKQYVDKPAFVEISLRIARHYQAKSDSYQQGNPNDPFKNHLKKAKEICEKAVQKYPKAHGSNECRGLIQEITARHFDLATEQVNAPNKPILALLRFKNASKFYFKTVRYYDRSEQQHFQDDNQRLAYYNSLPYLKKGEQALPDEGDFRGHTTEFKIDALPYGHFLIMVSDNPSFSNMEGGKVHYTFTNVSDMAYWHRNNNVKNEFVITDRTTGEPLKGVTAEFWSDEYDYTTRQNKTVKIGSDVSDERGFVLPSLKGGRNHYFRLKLIRGEDTLLTGDGYSDYFYKNDRTKVRHTHFFTDRAIYRPGQTVHFKAIVLETDADKATRILKKEAITVTFFDVNHQKVSELLLKTNDFGTVQGTFVAPTGGLTGRMSLHANVGESQHPIRVEEYKRPKFDTKFNPIEGTFVLNDEVKVKGSAKAYAGSNVDGAKVKFRVVRNVRYPYWGCGWGWWRPVPTGSAQEIVFGETVTDIEGNFEIKFKALPDRSVDKSTKPEFTYTVYADVTDITGETHATETSVSVGSIALRADIQVPEVLNRKQFKPFAITTTNLNGVFERSKGKITIDWVTAPNHNYITRFWEKPDAYLMPKNDFQRDFPNYAYKNEDLQREWVKKKTVLEEKFETKLGGSNDLKIESIKNWEAGTYKVTFQTQDAYGETIEIIKFFTLYDLDSKQLPMAGTQFSVLEKSVFEPNDRAEIYLGTAETRLPVLVELERDGKIVESRWTTLQKMEKIDLTITEKDRGNVFYHFNSVKNGRSYHEVRTLEVPWTNKELNFEYLTFRDKLAPGQEETWKIKVTGKNKDKFAAEMVAAMYDASLDKFAANHWNLSLYGTRYSSLGFSHATFKQAFANAFYSERASESIEETAKNYRFLNWFNFEYASGGGYSPYGRGRVMSRMMNDNASMPMPTSAPMRAADAEGGAVQKSAKKASMGAKEAPLTDTLSGNATIAEPKQPIGKNDDFSGVQIRTNLKETVFFYPNLETDADGNVFIKFKMNEALTKWKFLGLAHTADLKVGTTMKEIVTQKDLMVFPNAPRFFRENDQIEFTAKVSNLTDKTLIGSAQLQLLDAITMQPVDNQLDNKNPTISWEAKAGQSARLAWNLKIPIGEVQAVTYRVIAKAGAFGDGEESSLPVLTNRMLVTETLPLPVRGGETKTFTLENMKNAGGSKTLTHEKYVLEFTQNPAWYAVQALPYLMEYPYDCTEQIFSRFYANSLATSVANAHPKVKAVFERWKNVDVTALKSNLSKNQELKYALLEETPWVLAAQNEEIQKKNIGLLFDLNKMASEQKRALDKIAERQTSNGGFSWFPGGRDNWYITQYLAEGLGHLDKLGVNVLNNDPKTGEVARKAVQYCDARIVEEYNELEKEVKKGRTKWESDHLSNMAIHYMYMRSFFLKVPVSAEVKKVQDYYRSQMEKYWLKRGIYEQGMMSLALQRSNIGNKTSSAIVKSLKERSLNHPEMGMYWKYETGYFWYQLPIETHALMIEMFDEVARDAKSVDDLKVWLLKNKQTTHWKTTKATAAAVYALLRNGDNWLLEDKDVQITVGNEVLEVAKIQKEAGTGYFKTEFPKKEINTEMATVKVTNPNKVVAWGAAYWQYFEQLDKIKTFKETPLKLNKKLFKMQNTDKGVVSTPIAEDAAVSPGDKINVRIELRVDRPMEYVHLKDMRASGFEPVTVLSGYRWQDGLGYYESTRDAATNFFIDYLPKGTYVFEYQLVVNHKGNFSNGVTTIQCMYAPEFTSHSEGIRVTVK